MLNLIRAVINRLKILLATVAAQELESDCLLQHAERKAELLRQADRYADEGLTSIADELRQQAEAIHLDRPLECVLPALSHLQNTPETNLQQANGEPLALPVPTISNGAPGLLAPIASESPPQTNSSENRSDPKVTGRKKNR
jgi:hypothetical protein